VTLPVRFRILGDAGVTNQRRASRCVPWIFSGAAKAPRVVMMSLSARDYP
jgi:hypothetical protein